MAKNLLNDATVKALLAKPLDAEGNPLPLDAKGVPTDRTAKAFVRIEGKLVRRISDGDNLFLKVRFDLKGTPWYWANRTADGKETETALGHYPRVSLAEARKKRDKHAADQSSAAPVFVSQERKAKREQRKETTDRASRGLAPANTLVGMCQDYAASRGEGSKKPVKAGTVEQWQGWWKNYLGLVLDEQGTYAGVKGIGAMDPDKVVAADVVKFLRPIEQSVLATANGIRKHLNVAYQWAGRNKRVAGKHNPIDDAHEELTTNIESSTKPRPRQTTPEGVAMVLNALFAKQADTNTRTAHETWAALVMQALLFQRPENTVAMRWDEIVDGVWTIKRANLKIDDAKRGDHSIVLPRQALQVLEIMRPITGHSEWVFNSSQNPGHHLHLDRMSAVMRNTFGEDQVQSAHGFRGTARTMLQHELGLNWEVIEAQLDHAQVLQRQDGSFVRDNLKGAYLERRTFDAERGVLLQTWADYLDQLTGKPVVGLAVARPKYVRVRDAQADNAARRARRVAAPANDARVTAAA